MPETFECFQDGCAFMVRADSTEEVVHLVQEHADYHHDLDLDRDSIEPEIQAT